MFPKPKPALTPNTYAYESEPMVKATGFREYDARWLFEKEINLMGIQALGLGLGTLIHELGVKPEIVTAHDFRSYSASIKMALVAILGGVGTLFGPVVGAVVLTLIEEVTRVVFGGSGRGTDTIIYAGLIVVIAVFYPYGLIGWWRERRARAERRAAPWATKRPTSWTSPARVPSADRPTHPSDEGLS